MGVENLDISPGWRWKPQLALYLVPQFQRYHTVAYLLQHPRRVWLVVCSFMDPSSLFWHTSPILFSFTQHPLTWLLQIMCKMKLPQDSELGELPRWCSLFLLQGKSLQVKSTLYIFTLFRRIMVYIIGYLDSFYRCWQKDSSLYSNTYNCSLLDSATEKWMGADTHFSWFVFMPKCVCGWAWLCRIDWTNMILAITRQLG